MSALDQSVGRHIFTHCIRGLLKNKVIIFVTHQTHLLPQCDSVLLMNGGEQLAHGTYEDLMVRCPALRDLVGRSAAAEEEKSEEAGSGHKPPTPQTSKASLVTPASAPTVTASTTTASNGPVRFYLTCLIFSL